MNVTYIVKLHKIEGCAQTKLLVSWLLTNMLYKSEHMAIVHCTCTSNNLMPLELSKCICSPDISNFIGKPASFSGHFSHIKILLTFIQQVCQIKQITDYMYMDIEQCLSNNLIQNSAL